MYPNHRRQGEGHIKDGSFHIGLLTKQEQGQDRCVCGHILLHLNHLNQWRQGEGHIKDGCFNSRQYNVNNRAKIYHWAYLSPPQSSQPSAAVQSSYQRWMFSYRSPNNHGRAERGSPESSYQRWMFSYRSPNNYRPRGQAKLEYTAAYLSPPQSSQPSAAVQSSYQRWMFSYRSPNNHGDGGGGQLLLASPSPPHASQASAAG